MFVEMALRSPNVAVRVSDPVQVTLPEPPVGHQWVRNGFAVWDWVDLAKGDWFWLDSISKINPAWSQPFLATA